MASLDEFLAANPGALKTALEDNDIIILTRNPGGAAEDILVKLKALLDDKAPLSAAVTGTDAWYLTSHFAGSAEPISSNLSQVALTGWGTKGDSMTVSSGIFTFPSTGLWMIQATSCISLESSGSERNAQLLIQSTRNNADYDIISIGRASVFSDSTFTTSMRSAVAIMSVTDLANHKVRFDSIPTNSNTLTRGGSNDLQTYFIFTRIGDTE
ncbi:MAG: hypothetical protein WED82_01865 [Balneolales bacterium]